MSVLFACLIKRVSKLPLYQLVIILSVVRMVSNFLQRGGGGGLSRCLIIPYLSPYNLCFSKGSGLPSGSKHAILGLSGCCDKS